MNKFWVVLIILGVIAIAIGTTILYLIFGSGESKGNTVNLNKGEKPEGGSKNMGDEQSDTNIVQNTSQGGIHVLETTGMIHIDWKILMALSSIIIIAFMVKWAFQYKLFELIKCNLCTRGGNTKGENVKGDNQKLAEQGETKQKGDKHCDLRQNLEGANRARRGNMLETDNDRFEEVEDLGRNGNQDMEIFINGILQFIYEFRDMRR